MTKALSNFSQAGKLVVSASMQTFSNVRIIVKCPMVDMSFSNYS